MHRRQRDEASGREPELKTLVACTVVMIASNMPMIGDTRVILRLQTPLVHQDAQRIQRVDRLGHQLADGQSGRTVRAFAPVERQQEALASLQAPWTRGDEEISGLENSGYDYRTGSGPGSNIVRKTSMLVVVIDWNRSPWKCDSNPVRGCIGLTISSTTIPGCDAPAAAHSVVREWEHA